MARKARILVVGAGLTGATIARELADRGENPVVVERSADVGGFVKSLKVTAGGETYDHHVWGPHIFHTSNPDTWRWFDRFAELTPVTFTSLVVTPGGKELPMPISYHTTEHYRATHTATPQALMREIFSRRDPCLPPLSSIPPDSFERVLREKVGDWLYQACFQQYTEVFWGRPASEIPGSIAARIPIRQNWDVRYHSDSFVGVPGIGYSEAILRMLEGIPVICGSQLSARALSVNAWDSIYWTGSLADPSLGGEISPQRFLYRKIKVTTRWGVIDNQAGFQQRMLNNCAPPGESEADQKPWTTVRRYVSANLKPRPELVDAALSSFIEVQRADASDPQEEGLAYPLPVPPDAVTFREMKIRKVLDHDRFFLAGRLGRHQYLDMNRAIEQARRLVADTI